MPNTGLFIKDIAICSAIYAVIYFFQNYFVFNKIVAKNICQDELMPLYQLKSYVYGCLADVKSVLICAVVIDICGGGFLFENSFSSFVYGILYSVLWVLASPAYFDVISILLMLIPILISTVLRFIFYYFIVFKEVEFNSNRKYKSILRIAISSAPYYFLFPMVLVLMLFKLM